MFGISFGLHSCRFSFSITTILTTILLTGTVNASMPKVSYAKALDYFLMTSLGFIFMSLLEYVLVLNTHPNFRKEKEDDEVAEEMKPLNSENSKVWGRANVHLVVVIIFIKESF